MKISNIIVIGLIFIFCSAANGQEPVKQSSDSTNSTYDAELAKKLGADDYGMKKFVFVILKRGTAKIEDPEERKKLMAGHMANINRLAEEGKLVIAGPFLEDPNVRGIYIFDVRTIEEAKKLVETDPSVKAGIFDVELRLWFGSAALLEVTKIHKKIAKKNF